MMFSTDLYVVMEHTARRTGEIKYESLEPAFKAQLANALIDDQKSFFELLDEDEMLRVTEALQRALIQRGARLRNTTALQELGETIESIAFDFAESFLKEEYEQVATIVLADRFEEKDWREDL